MYNYIVHFFNMMGLVAISKNNIIGYDGKLPWKCKEDLAWFKSITLNKQIIVGHTTYKNLPKLPNRKVLVLTDSKKENFYDPFTDHAMCTVSYIDVLKMKNMKDLIVCGGMQTYRTFASLIDTLFVTRIDLDFIGDTEFDTELFNQFHPPIIYKKLSDIATIYVYRHKTAQYEYNK